MEIDPELVVPDPVAVDRRGGDPALVERRDELLRADHPGDRRPLRDRPRDRLGGAALRAARDLFLYGTNGDRVYVSYRNRMGRQRSYMTAFEGIVPNLERRYRETDSDWSREKIEEYMSMRPCPECHGARLRPESRAVTVAGMAIHEYTTLSAQRALPGSTALELSESDRAIARLILREIEERLRFLDNVGVGYLVDGAGGGDAVGRRGAADPAGDPDRLLAGRRALHPRRAVDRPAPARQREADRARSSACATSATPCSWSSTTRAPCAPPTTWSTWGPARASTAATSSPRAPPRRSWRCRSR